MPLTGNVARTFGQVLLALGVVGLVLGILGFVLGAFVLDRALDDPRMQDGDTGDVIGGLFQAGLALTAAGTLLLVLGIVLVGIGRGLRERLQRRLATRPAGPESIGLAGRTGADS